MRKNDIRGRFYCLEVFDPKEIKAWVKDSSGTAICPHYGIDSSIGESGGLPITIEFFTRMKQRWFSNCVF